MARRHATNGVATAALVLGLIGVVAALLPVLFVVAVPCGVLAVVLGILGRRRATGGAEGGGSAMAGLVCGVLALVLVLGIFLIPAS